MKIGLGVHAVLRLSSSFANAEGAKKSLQQPKHGVFEVAVVSKREGSRAVERSMVPYLYGSTPDPLATLCGKTCQNRDAVPPGYLSQAAGGRR